MSDLNRERPSVGMSAYLRQGERRARRLGNRGPLKLCADGTLAPDILEAYGRCGFYIFEGLVGDTELEDLETDLHKVLERAPVGKSAQLDASGRIAIGREFTLPTFDFSRPLSDPLGGTDKNDGRHPAKMREPTPPADAPDHVISNIYGPLQIMDSYLRLYGHPQLLRIAEQINGPDFTPFTEAIFIKQPGLGVSVAWHQDGVTHWDNPDLDQHTHGFNFMLQLYGSTAANGVWVLPGSQTQGKIDIRELIEANRGCDQLPGAVPIVCGAGDVALCNRQTLHGSFANTSPDMRVTLNLGFHPRRSVLNVRGKYKNKEVLYDAAYVHRRSRLISLGIDARHRHFPDEERYVYQPMVGEEDANRWSERARQSLLKNYNQRDLGI